MKPTSLILIFLFVCGTTFGQTWTAGPRLDVQLSASKQLDALYIGDYQFSSGSADYFGGFWGGFVRYDRPRWYAQAEYGRGTFGATSFRQIPSSGYGYRLRALRQDIQVTAGVKLLPWLRLSGGLAYARYAWEPSEDGRRYEFIRQQLLTEQNPVLIEARQRELPYYNIGRQIDAAYRRSNLEGTVGLGVDIGGFMIDLTYARSLTPVLNGITVNATTYPTRYPYRYTSFRLGYRLFPLKAYLLAPRKSNRAYQRIKRDIPFYRNEVHALVGITTEDFGREFLYENRYTRYLSRRVGLAGGLMLSRSFAGAGENVFLPKIRTAYSLTTGIRVLPLYSRYHTIGITTGPTLTYEQRTAPTSGRRSTQNGQVVSTVKLRDDAYAERVLVGWQTTLDYHVAITDRLIAGPWLRVFGESIVPDYASVGIQAGYRF